MQARWLYNGGVTSGLYTERMGDVFCMTHHLFVWVAYVACESRAPEDFLEWKYDMLDTSATRVIHYRLKSQEASP